MPNYARLDALINSSAVQDQLEALMEIQALIPLECEDDSSKLTSFANFLRLPFGSSSDPQVLAHASRALGQLAQLGGNEAVEPELKRALQRLKVCNRLDSAVLVVKELAQHAPTLVYVHVADVIEHIWAAIRDSRVPVREGAARALCACLELMAGRESRSRAKWYDRVYEEARAGFDAGSVEAVHGALLTTTELLGESGAPLSEAKLRDVFDLAWAHREHREKLVRRAVVALVPKLAEHCARSPHAGALFVQTYLSMTIAHLLNTLRTSSSDLREAAFLAIGDTAIATSRCPRRALLSSASVASGGGRSPDAGGPSADAPPLPRSPSPKAPKAATADEKAAKGVGWLLRGYNRSSAATPASLRPPVDYPPLSPRSSDGDGGSRVGRRYSASHPFLPFVAGVLKEVRESLTPSKRGPSKRAAYCAEAIVCVAKLAEALGEELEPQCEDLYPHLFSHGLSEKLRASLVLMATHIPSQLHALQRRVLDAVCLVLARCPFSEWQRLSPHERASGCAAAASESHDDAAVAQQVTLALQTLGAFNEGDWSGQPQVLAFVHECASCFLDSDEVRFAPRAPPPPPAVPLVVVAPSPPSPRTTPPTTPSPSPPPFIYPRPPPRTRNSPLIRCTSAVLPPKGAVGYSCTLRSDPRRRKVRRVASPGAAATTSYPRRSLVAALPPRPPGVCSPRQSLGSTRLRRAALAARSATGEPPASWPGPPLPRLVEPAAAAAPDCASVRRACARKFCRRCSSPAWLTRTARSGSSYGTRLARASTRSLRIQMRSAAFSWR